MPQRGGRGGGETRRLRAHRGPRGRAGASATRGGGGAAGGEEGGGSAGHVDPGGDRRPGDEPLHGRGVQEGRQIVPTSGTGRLGSAELSCVGLVRGAATARHGGCWVL
jgi:hypothetical protein